MALFPYVALGVIRGPDISELIGGLSFGGVLHQVTLECLSPAPVGGQGQMFSPGNTWGLQLPTLLRKRSEKSMDAKSVACCPGDQFRGVLETVVRGYIFKANARLLPEDHGILHSSLPGIDSPCVACDLWRNEDIPPRVSPCPRSISFCRTVK